MKKLIVMLLSTVVLLTACPDNGGGPGPGPAPSPTPPGPVTQNLKIHPLNPHYFQEMPSGKPVLIAASENIVPTDVEFDDMANIDSIIAKGYYYVRVWHLLAWAGPNVHWPWFRLQSNPSKWDFSRWNETYWERMHTSLSKTSKANITAEIMVFDRVGMSPAAANRWEANPWASDNNINGLETPARHLDGTPEFYQIAARPKLRAEQEKYVRRLIDETYKYNVIYEIENEHWEYNDPQWAQYWAEFIKEHLATKQVNRLVSYGSLQKDMEVFYQRDSVDVLNKHYGQEPENDVNVLNEYIESRWQYNKPINIDEFANGLGDTNILRKMLWTIVTSGGHFHIEDAVPESNPTGNTQAIHKFLKDSQWNFVASHPQKNYSNTGYCMISDQEKLCYYINGGNKQMPLPAGNYKATWYRSATGEAASTVEFQHGGGSKALTSPNNGDWVLHVKNM